MTKQDYLNKILRLCTEEQQALFNSMYCKGPDLKQLDRAIAQVEHTLRVQNIDKAAYRKLEREKNEVEAELRLQLKNIESDLKRSEDRLNEVDRENRMLRNPILLDNVHVQEKCDLLDALQAGGVDNWEGYEAAVNNWKIEAE